MKNFKLVISLLALVLLSSCDNYFGINDVNPNAPQIEDVPPRLMLPGAMSQTFRTQATSMNQLGSIMTNAWAGNVNSFASPYSREYRLAVDNAFYNPIWDGLYRNVANFDFIQKYPNADQSQDQFVAVAKIMKSYYMQYIVDLYGKSPYSQAFQYQLNVNPAYDNDFETYKSLINELDNARNLIAALPGTEEQLGASDIMMGGDLNRWVEFANTVELRMLIRMRSSTFPGVAAYVASRLPALVGQPFISEDVTINPGYDNTADEKQNPFFANFVFSTTAVAQNRSLVVASGHIARILNGGFAVVNNVVTADPAYAKYTPLVITGAGRDRRATNMFFAIGGRIRGVKQGNSSSDTAGSGTSQVSRLGIIPTRMASISNNLTVTAAQRDYAATQPGFVMLAAESYFLQAEAAEFLDPGFGSAQNLFETGIEKSYEYYSWLGSLYGPGLTISPVAYIAASSTIPGVGWTGSQTDKLEAIMFQKWMALHSVHGIEPFIEYNRTGFPWTPLATSAEQTVKPYRLSYPVSEFVANASNVINIPQAQLFTVNSNSPFWKQ